MVAKYLFLQASHTIIHKLVDFGGYHVFDATVDTNITLVTKGNLPNQKISYMNFFDKKQALTNMNNPRNYGLININEFEGSSWILVNDEKLLLKKKIESEGIKLRDLNTIINLGIKTGLNHAFIIDNKCREKLIGLDSNNEEIIKPILRGRDLGCYFYNFSNYWLINSHNGIKEKNIPPIDVEKEYPTIYKYLSQFGDRIRHRTDRGDHWTNLRNCAYLNDFKKEKIVWADIATESKFVWIEDEIFINNTCYMISNAEKYLITILNSSLINWYFPLISSDLSSNGSRYFKQFVELIPIPQTNNSERNELVKYMEEFIKTGNELFLQKINNIVYSLYNLTKDEIAIIEGQKNEKRRNIK